MAKAYDRVSWSYTCIMLRIMGFNERIIDMIWRTMGNNWYSIIITGTRCGFFHSTRGLKQGDPLAPSLFIIRVELLFRMLNNLTHDQFFNGLYIEWRDPQINHLTFADDIIIFTSGGRASLQKIMEILNNYEHTSRQQINRQKSHFMVSPPAFPATIRGVQQITGFTKKESPITYMGCPLYIGRMRIVYFNSLVAKVISRIKGWQSRILSYGGRATMIKHVLQSIPTHLLSALTPSPPPKTILRRVEKLAANFFWGMEKDKNIYHRASWQKLTFPTEEGGVGIKSMEDFCQTMKFEKWWLFRTKDSLWSKFLRAKYCQRSNSISKKWNSGQSQKWKKMMINKKESEKHITWRLHSGSCNFWWDNWLGDGALY
uniref:Reverse transcriptase domain-containing protein n=1 Tax=Nicotiana tabacum TaxID=4097 RepID=A0A1S3ZXF8_TOBAC|nr:PREDICTED: uncharacterized protein LOC107791464 [Nicotiana tabacum]